MRATDRRGPAIGLAAVACLLACETSQSGGGGGPPGVETNVAPTESTPDQQASVAFFDDSRMHEVRLWMSDDDFKSIIEDTRGDDMRSATFSIDGVVMARVGVRPSGESSRVPGNQKMSMRIEFDAFDMGKRMGGVVEVKLSGSWDDPFIVRDRLAYWVYRQVMPAPRETAAQVWVNGQPRGVFELEEVWGKEALASRSPTRIRTNTRARIRWRTCRCPGIPSGGRWSTRWPTRSSAPRCRWWRRIRGASAT